MPPACHPSGTAATGKTLTADRPAEAGGERPAEQLDLASAEEIARAVAAGEEQLFSVGLYVCLRAPAVADLDALERRVRERLLALGVSLSSIRWQHAAGFRTAGVLYAADKLGRRRTLDTTTLALSLPFLASTVGTKGGPLVAVSPADRAPVFLDLYAREEGWNAPGLCIVSPPGGGETVTTRRPRPSRPSSRRSTVGSPTTATACGSGSRSNGGPLPQAYTARPSVLRSSSNPPAQKPAPPGGGRAEPATWGSASKP